MKRGQARIITIVLLIVIVLIAIVVIWNVVKKTVTEKTEEIDIKLMTTDVTIGKASVHINETENKLQLSVTRGADEAELSSMKIVVLGKEDSKIYTIPDYPETLETKTYVLNISGLSNITKILVYPVSAKGKIGIEERYEVTGKEPGEINDELPMYNPESENGGTTPPLCIYGEWINQGCGLDGCGSGQMYQNRSVISGTGCSDTENCTVNETCTLYPLIVFGAGTETNGSTITRDNIFINVSATGKNNNISMFIDFDNSLVSWWRMDDVSGTTVIDYMNRNNGTAVNAVQTDAGYLGKAFSFDGDGDYISISSLTLDSSWSLSLWMNVTPKGYEPSNSIFGDSNLYYDYLLVREHVDDISLETTYNTDAANICVGYVNHTLGEWAHYVVTRDGGNVSCYKNGTYIDSAQLPQGSTYFNTIDRIGAGYYDKEFYGGMDDVMIFNRSLSAGEISALYANSSSKYLFRNFTGLQNGNHTFKAYVQDLVGNISSTETRSVNVSKT